MFDIFGIGEVLQRAEDPIKFRSIMKEPCAAQMFNRFTPVVSVVDGDDEIRVYVELPGVNKEDVEAEFEDNVLIVTGEKKPYKNEKPFYTEVASGPFKREIKFADDVIAEKTTAQFSDGVLEVVVLKDIEKINKTNIQIT